LTTKNFVIQAFRPVASCQTCSVNAALVRFWKLKFEFVRLSLDRITDKLTGKTSFKFDLA